MVRLSTRVTRVRAPNPSPMTLSGTNSYVIDAGAGRAIVVDPGPSIEAHIAAIEAAASAETTVIDAILVTHGHPDHAPGAALLRARAGAPVYAHRNARFPHDIELGDNEQLAVANVRITALDAPGHADDHLVFFLNEERALFTGDVVIGEGTVVIAPPHGNMRDYQATLERLLHLYGDASAIYGGHGPEISDVRSKLSEYIDHRKMREGQLLAALERGPATVPELVRTIYAATNPIVWPAAARQMIAYLNALENEGRVAVTLLEGEPSEADADILNPDLSRLAMIGNLDAVATEELGVHMGREELRSYALAT